MVPLLKRAEQNLKPSLGLSKCRAKCNRTCCTSVKSALFLPNTSENIYPHNDLYLNVLYIAALTMVIPNWKKKTSIYQLMIKYIAINP